MALSEAGGKCGIIRRMEKKVRVFELARAKNIGIARTVELLTERGIPNASAISYVDPAVLDDVPGASRTPAPNAPAGEKRTFGDESAMGRQMHQSRSAALDARYGAGERDHGRGGESSRMVSLLAVGLSVITVMLAGFVFLSEREDREELRKIAVDVAAVKGSMGKIEEVAANNRAQIMEMRDQVSGMEKRIYEFKRSSLLVQLKSQGVVLRALSENLNDPLKGKVQALVSRLSSF